MGIGLFGKIYTALSFTLSSCLDVSRIKSLWTDAIVSLDINALPPAVCWYARGCCRCRSPVGVAIQVTWLSSLVGGFLGRSVSLPLVSRWAWLWCHQISTCGLTVVCSGGFGIVYKCCAVAGSSSLDTAPVSSDWVTSLRHFCMLPYRLLYCGFRWCVLIECSDCLRLAVCQAFRFLQ